MPVTVHQPPPPAPAGDEPGPVVAIVDTPVVDVAGGTRHDGASWFPDLVDANGQQVGVVERRPLVGDVPIGDHDLIGRSLVTDGLLRQVLPQAGHGTFIAGLVRQVAPTARLVSVPLFGPDGVVPEREFLDVLQRLVVRQVRARHGGQDGAHRGGHLDVVCLSLGYYHELPDDPIFSDVLATRIDALGLLGVSVVVAAGNDATVREFYPAALAPTAEAPASSDRIPVVAVGATNADGTSALFSNDGPWVSIWRPGVSLVSTFPTIDAGGAPDVQVESPYGRVRASLDPDDYRGGHAVWSGTSFAAPLVAAEIANRIADGDLPTGETPVEEVVANVWQALARIEDLDHLRPDS